MNFKTIVLSFLFCSFLLNNSLSAQNEFEAGYLVLLNGDTISGEIKRELSEHSFDIVVDSKKKPVRYKTREISSVYFLQGKLYQTNKVEKNKLLVDVFFECLVLGEVSLYSYVDEQLSERFFIKNQENEIRELLYIEEEVKDSNGHRFLKKKKLYRGELNYSLRNCTSSQVKKQIDNLKLDKESLLKLFKNYYACTQKRGNFFGTQKKKRKIEVGLYVGGSTLDGDDINSRYAKILLGFGGGIFINTYIPKSNGRYSVEIGIARYFFEEELKKDFLILAEGRLLVQRHTSIKGKVDLVFKGGVNRIRVDDFGRMGLVVGAGVGYKIIGKLKVFHNLEMRLQSPRVFQLNIGFKI